MRWTGRGRFGRAPSRVRGSEGASVRSDDRADVLVAQRAGEVAGDEAVDELDGVDVPGGLEHLAGLNPAARVYVKDRHQPRTGVTG